MKATEIKYLKRFNLGDYQHEEFGVTLSIDEDANPVEALKEAKAMVHAAQEGAVVKESVEETEVESLPEKKSKKPKSEMAPGVKKSKPGQKAKKEEEEDEESEEEINEEGSEEDENDDESEGEEESEQEEVEEKPKRGSKSKSAVYDRTNDLHKNLVGKMLTHYFPEWRTKLKETAVLTSKKMQGKEFLNKDGMILKTFEDEFVKIMKKKK